MCRIGTDHFPKSMGRILRERESIKFFSGWSSVCGLHEGSSGTDSLPVFARPYEGRTSRDRRSVQGRGSGRSLRKRRTLIQLITSFLPYIVPDFQEAWEMFGNEGRRVIAFAQKYFNDKSNASFDKDCEQKWAIWNSFHFHSLLSDLTYNYLHYLSRWNGQLEFLGMAAIMDPPRLVITVRFVSRRGPESRTLMIVLLYSFLIQTRSSFCHPTVQGSGHQSAHGHWRPSDHSHCSRTTNWTDWGESGQR